MRLHQSLLCSSKVAAVGLAAGIFGTCLFLEESTSPKKALASPALMEFRWDNTDNYKKLYYWQSSSEKRDRATYYLVMRPKDRRTAILKLKITLPNYFDAKIKPEKLSLCRVSLGGMLTRTKCLEKIPAVFEVAKKQEYIEVFPDEPIPEDQAYAIKMKIFNPAKTGMFQLNALAQSPGDLPITRYIGSWNIDVE